MSTTERTVAEAILDQLATWGVRRIYGYAGDAILTFLDAINCHPKIEYIGTRHEGAAAFMASAEAKLTGRVGVCTATSGPGAANLINGLADAFLDKAPVIAITGQVPAKYIGTGYKQYIDEQILLNPVTKYNTLLIDPQPTVEVVYKALQIAMGQGTVANISVPKDTFDKPCSTPPRLQDVLFPAHKLPQDQGIKEAINLLNKAKKPMFLIGRGAQGKGELVKKLADKLGAAIAYSLPAKGVISSDFKYLVGGLGLAGTNKASNLLSEADCLLTIGATWWPQKFVPQEIPIIQLDAILENIGLQANITLGVEGCIRKALQFILDGTKAKSNKKWREIISSTRKNWLVRLEEEANANENPITPQRLVYSVEQALDQDAIITLDVGEHVLWFDKMFQGKGQNILISGSWRSMGFGLPAALSAQLEFPKRQVVTLMGDGGFTMSMPELVTAVEKGLAVKVVVFNNKYLSMEKNRMIVSGLSQTGTNLYNPDFSEVAKACGLEGYKVADVKELDEVIIKAFKSNKPSLVEVEVSSPIPPHTTL
ncbi:MAG: thiamine pyrophosphate-binding protein [Peptococcales bacterium]|jgi:pyruvate oxidase